MNITLETQNTNDGIRCTYKDGGDYAGTIAYLIAATDGKKWHSIPRDGEHAKFCTLEAAEYHMLAYAIESRMIASFISHDIGKRIRATQEMQHKCEGGAHAWRKQTAQEKSDNVVPACAVCGADAFES